MPDDRQSDARNLCPWDRLIDRENGFDTARLVLATLVVFEHAYYLPYNNYKAEPLFLFSRGQTDFGALAVNGFFVISGFLITRSCLLTNDASRYATKRLARIVPGFLLASCLGLFVFGPLGADDVGAYFANINWRATFVQIVSLHQSGVGSTFLHNPMKGIYDGTIWTIRPEFDCYLLVGLLWAFRLLRREFIIVLLLVLLTCRQLQSSGVISLPIINSGVLALFASAQFLAAPVWLFFHRVGLLFVAGIYPEIDLAFCHFAGLVARCSPLGRRASRDAVRRGLRHFLFGPVRGRTLRVAGRKIDLSYGIYLFGFPIQQLLIAATGQAIGPETLFLVSFPITCGIAYLSWTFVEGPCLRWAHQRTRPRASAASPPIEVGSAEAAWPRP